MIRLRKNYWKECCLLIIGFFVGMIVERNNIPTIPISVDVKRDTLVTKDTLYVIRESLNRENVLAEIKKQGIPHPHIVLAQSRLETGEYTSKLCKTHRNLFGMKKGNSYRKYDSWKESVADYKRLISSRYKQGEDYYAFLERIKYAESGVYTEALRRFV